jgi:hypothetical protein
MKRATIGGCTLLFVSSVFLLPAHVNMVGTKSSSSLMQVTSGYEVFDSRKVLAAKGEHGNSMAEMSLPHDVTWTDPGTGLMWTKEDNGGRINWNEANQFCRDMKVKDYSDWRLRNYAGSSIKHRTSVVITSKAGFTLACAASGAAALGWIRIRGGCCTSLVAGAYPGGSTTPSRSCACAVPQNETGGESNRRMN